MKFLLKIWLILLTGVLVGISVRQDSGHIILTFNHYSVEMTLVLFLILNGLLFAILYFLIRLWIRTYQAPANIYAWYQKYRIRRSHKNLTRGLVDLAGGNWEKAEKKLLHSASEGEASLINYLGAAKAAQQQGNTERRDSYIRLAYAQIPAANVAIGLTQAELQLADRQLEQALATLQNLHEITPGHAHILRLLYQLYETLSDWEKLIQLLPELRQYKVFNPEQLNKTELKIRREYLKKVAYTRSADELISTWKKQPRSLQKNPEFFSDYISHLKYQHSDETAESLLYKKFHDKWQPDLLEIYTELNISNPGKHLRQLERYLVKYPEDAMLLFTLGRLSLQAELWGKARDYLKKCVQQAQPPEAAYRELGRLSECMGELQEAAAYYRKALFPDDKAIMRLSSQIIRPATLPEKPIREPAPHGAIQSD